MGTGNPLVNQGYLNRVKGSLTVTDTPALNVTAPYLGRDMISMRPITAATDIIPTATGTVGSQAAYQQVELTIHVLKTTALGNLWKRRFESSTALGEVVFTTDSTVLDSYTINNAYITNFDAINANGSDATIVITIGGNLIVNNDLWG